MLLMLVRYSLETLRRQIHERRVWGGIWARDVTLGAVCVVMLLQVVKCRLQVE